MDVRIFVNYVGLCSRLSDEILCSSVVWEVEKMTCVGVDCALVASCAVLLYSPIRGPHVTPTSSHLPGHL